MTVGLVITCSRSRTGMDGSLTSNLNFQTPWKICRRVIINLCKVRNTVHFITVITATWRRRRRRRYAPCTELASALFTTISFLNNCNRIYSHQSMDHGDVRINGEDRNLRNAGQLRCLQVSCILGSPYNKKAELSQRWPRDAPYIYGALKIFESPWVAMPTTILFPKFVMGFCWDLSYKCDYKIWSS